MARDQNYKSMPPKRTYEDFLIEARKRHGDKYDYQEVKYVNRKTKVQIGCLVCGATFWQTPDVHSGQGRGCLDCATKQGAKKRTYTQEQFVAQAQERHPELYDYSLAKYVRGDAKVEIICLRCANRFWQTPTDHINSGHGCPQCGVARVVKAMTHTQEHFEAKAKARHPGLYDYSRARYIGARIALEIICLRCGQSFWQLPTSHIDHRCGCPRCNRSKGEAIIAQLLTERKISFVTQQRYPEQLERRSFDFLAQSQSGQVLLEFDGGQHFYSVERFGGEAGFKRRQDHDLSKSLFAIGNRIPLIRFDYTISDRSIGAYLDEALFSIRDFDLILTSAHLYGYLINQVYDQYPNARILCLNEDMPDKCDKPATVDTQILQNLLIVAVGSLAMYVIAAY